LWTIARIMPRGRHFPLADPIRRNIPKTKFC
jgi:hypothetical protein